MATKAADAPLVEDLKEEKKDTSLSIDDLIGGDSSAVSTVKGAAPASVNRSFPLSSPSRATSSPRGYVRRPIISNRGYAPVAAGSAQGSVSTSFAPSRPVENSSSYAQAQDPMPVQSASNGGPRSSYGSGYSSSNGVEGIPDEGLPTSEMTGILDVQPEGHGFLRPKFIPSDLDIYISQSQIRRFNLRPGDMVTGQARAPKENERYYGLLKVEKANGEPVGSISGRPKFEDLTPVYPYKKLKLETGKNPLSTRLLDLVAPIGKGQRGMVVSPPKAGKTWLLKDIANGITTNYPEGEKDGVHLMVVLVGERPEEVTDIARSVKGEVIASNFDEPAESQTRVAEVSLDRAKRLVEMGRDVVILLDSITRLARAYNLCIPPSGRTLSGGFDPVALYPPKKFFGAARAIEGGGSLTIIGTALIDTGSRMDDLIYEEFKGTGNMELHLDRKLSERRIFPSIDVSRSGTRHEELLFAEEDMKKIVTMRRMMEVLGEGERTELLLDRLAKMKDNEEFLKSLGK